MPNVRMPDGTVVAFPDDMPNDQIKSLIASKFPDVTAASPSSAAMIEVELPDGTIAEFPAGTSHETMRSALQRKFPAPASASPSEPKAKWWEAAPLVEQPAQKNWWDDAPLVEQSKPDLGRIKNNVRKMAQQNAPETDIDGYIASEGVTVEDVRKFRQPNPSHALGQPASGGDAKRFVITAPDGKKYRITGETSGGALNALKKHLGDSSGAAGASHPEFDGSGIPGYNPSTGMVDRGKSDSGVLAGLSSALEGIPIAGPYLQSGSEMTAARIASLISGQPYDKVHGEMSDMVDSAQAANPGISLASGIGGSIAGTIPAVLAAPAAFGAGGGSILARSIASAITGAGIGGADSAVRSGGDLDAVGTGLMVGGITGAAGPGAGKAIGAGWQGIRNIRANSAAAKAAGVNTSTLSKLGRAVRDDGLDPSAIASRMQELGPDAMLMDLGPNLQRQAGALAASPGRGQEIIRGGIAARDAGANARIRGAVDDTLGPAGSPSQIDGAIRSNQQVVGQAYEQAFRNARAVDTTPLAQNLESAAVNLRGAGQKAVRDVRQMLNVNGTDQLDPNPYTLFQTRQAIDGMMATNADTNAIRVLSGARQQVDDMLSRSVPGIKEIDGQFAELARQREALTRGQQVLDSGRTAPRPQELAQEVQQGALPQGRQIGPSAAPLRLRDGARAEIDRIVGTNANDRVALQRVIKGEGDWNRSRLATLFGQERADRIINVLDRERLFSETSNIVTRNSETAARTAAMKEITGETAPQFGIREGYMSGGLLGSARSAGVKTVERLRDMLMSANRDAANSGLARALSDKNTDGVVRALKQAQGRRPVDQKLIEELARSIMIGGGSGATRP